LNLQVGPQQSRLVAVVSSDNRRMFVFEVKVGVVLASCGPERNARTGYHLELPGSRITRRK
jgi:hypothetical protein